MQLEPQFLLLVQQPQIYVVEADSLLAGTKKSQQTLPCKWGNLFCYEIRYRIDFCQV